MAAGTHKRQQAEAAKAKRDLKRLEEQSEKLINPSLHEDVNPDDSVEKWGRIIGRSAGYIIVVYLVYHLVTTYVMNMPK